MWKLLQFGRKRRSLTDALRSVMDKRQVEQVLHSTPDRRHLVEAAAQVIGVTEGELLQRVARWFDLTVLDKPAPADLLVVQSTCLGVTISDFRRAGIIPITSPDGVHGLVCVDPTAVDALSEPIRQLPLYLATWESIARALHESEKELRDREERESQSAARQLEAVTKEVLSALIQEVDSFVSNEFVIHFPPGEQITRYSFETSDGRRASGEVNALVRDELYALLLSLSKGAHPSGVIFPPSWQRGVLQVSHDAEGASFSISNRARVSTPVVKASELGGKLVQFPGVQERGDTPLAPAPAPVEPARPLILVVDDNPTFARVLERFFDRNGAASAHAPSGAAAIELLSSGTMKPDLIVCDVHMPLMNGVEFLKQIRQSEQLRLTPAVMLTSDTDIEIEIELLGAGADAYVRKQDDPRLLWVHVKRLLDQRNRQRAA